MKNFARPERREEGGSNVIFFRRGDKHSCDSGDPAAAGTIKPLPAGISWRDGFFGKVRVRDPLKTGPDWFRVLQNQTETRANRTALNPGTHFSDPFSAQMCFHSFGTFVALLLRPFSFFPRFRRISAGLFQYFRVSR